MNRRFYWLRLKQDFFAQVTVKKLRRSEYGDKAAILYLEMMLLSISNDGAIVFEGVCSDIFEEIALALDEAPQTVKDVCELLQKMGRLEVLDSDTGLEGSK